MVFNMPQNAIETMLNCIRNRRATRHFHDTPIDETTLLTLLDAARWAPSGYNLQPVHPIVVTDPEQKRRLSWACVNQPQVGEAPATVVFAADKQVATNNFEAVIASDREAGAIDARYEGFLRKYVPLAFRTGPVGLNWLWKATLPPVLRWFTAVPSLPAVQRRYWLAKQTSLAAMNFMLAAEAAGLATCPIEGFDERRVRKVLAMPRSALPIIVVPVGHPATSPVAKTRLPSDRLVHWQRW
jgi:nitroreductase